MEAKVGIQIEGVDDCLFVIDRNKSLRKNIQDICDRHSLGGVSSYDLKFAYKNLTNYVTEDNFEDIKDGHTLQLVESLDSITTRIFAEDSDRIGRFDTIYKLSFDPGFIKLLVQKGLHKQIITAIAEEQLLGKQLSACLITFLHMLKKHYVKDVEEQVLNKIIHCVNSESHPSEVQYALSVLCQILYLRGQELQNAKHAIASSISVNDLIPFIWSEDNTILQLNTLMLINAIVKFLKGDKRVEMIKELGKSKNREYIFNHVINKKTVSSGMAHELYVLQTYLLSLHNEALNTSVDGDNNFFESDVGQDRDSRGSTFSETGESVSRSRTNSTIICSETTRLSRASSISSVNGNPHLPKTGDFTEPTKISLLTMDCLTYYKTNHFQSFRQSKLDEDQPNPGFYSISESIVKLLARLLHIGMDPLKESTEYIPLLFNGKLRGSFLHELFSRVIRLYSKTKREMRARCPNDSAQVLCILEKQIKMVFERQPLDYATLSKHARAIRYQNVQARLQEENDQKWQEMYCQHPCVQELKERFVKANMALVVDRRINIMVEGEVFPKLPEKRGKNKYLFMRLSENRQSVVWGDCDVLQSKLEMQEQLKFNVSDIKHCITGAACPHVKDNTVKQPERAFSLIFADDSCLHFLAKDSKIASNWVDGFNYILGKNIQSDQFKEELETLVEMDSALHLMELQNVPILTEPPAVPPLPPPPMVPPKPFFLTTQVRASHLYRSRRQISNNVVE